VIYYFTREAFEESNINIEISVAKKWKELDFLLEDHYLDAKKKPDLILLDMNIPIYNGHGVLQQIKADPILKKDTCVIILTTSSKRKKI
jgi:CheY-like chemotaxis protein